MTATVVETLCYTVIIGYNINNYYAISTYGDVFACWIQNLGICGLLAWYRRPTKLQMTVGMILFIAFNWWTICGYCGMRVLTLMQVRQHTFAASSRAQGCMSYAPRIYASPCHPILCVCYDFHSQYGCVWSYNWEDGHWSESIIRASCAGVCWRCNESRSTCSTDSTQHATREHR